MNSIPEQLIRNALTLTGISEGDFIESIEYATEYSTSVTGEPIRRQVVDKTEYNIEKLCYYLLSDDFLRAYLKSIYQYAKSTEDERVEFVILRDFSKAIYYYQKGNPETLISLLSKIPGTK